MRPRARSAQQSLGQIVLGFEFVVVFLGALVAFGLKAVPPAIALGGGGALVVIMLATVGLLRYRWGFALGWALQVIVIASGFLVGMMFIVGAIFTGMWAYAMIAGERLDRTNAALAASAAASDNNGTNETENPE
ncbi:MAG TPA: DUF4233 domain-containing protein [Microbacteriaceae bacterium]